MQADRGAADGGTHARAGVSSGRATRQVIRTIAFIEGFKGVVVLLVASGLLALVHKDLNAVATRWVEHSHLNPASKYPQIFVDAMSHLQEPRLLWLAAGAAAYSTVRLIEAYGLFRERAWAEWLAALSGGLYIPVEIVEIVRKPTGLSFTVLAVNVVVVAVMVWALVARQRK